MAINTLVDSNHDEFGSGNPQVFSLTRTAQSGQGRQVTVTVPQVRVTAGHSHSVRARAQSRCEARGRKSDFRPPGHFHSRLGPAAATAGQTVDGDDVPIS